MTFTFKRFMASGLLTKYEASIEQLPMREAVKYNSIKNGKWTATELKVHLQQFKYNFTSLHFISLHSTSYSHFLFLSFRQK